MSAKIIAFPKKEEPWRGLFGKSVWPNSRLWRIGVQILDAADLHPAVKFFELLAHFDEVKLPQDTAFRLEAGQLQILRDGEWERCEWTVNELLEAVTGLTQIEWLATKTRSRRHNLVEIFGGFLSGGVKREKAPSD